jgi:hypothetical protein
MNLPPGATGLPLVGETLAFLQSPQKFATQRQQKQCLFRTHLFGNPAVVRLSDGRGTQAERASMSHDFDIWTEGLFAAPTCC